MALSIIAYLAIATFIIAVLYRVIRVANTPAHLRWDLYPVPHEGFAKAKYGGSYYEDLDWWTKPRHVNKFSEISAMIPEIIFLKGVWEANRGLWFWSWAFHFGLYLAIGLAALAIISIFTGTAEGIGALIVSVAGPIGIIGYALGTLGCLGMLFKRTADEKLKNFTTGGAIFNLLFILAISVTGLLAMINMGMNEYVTTLGQFLSSLIGLGGNANVTSLFAANLIITLLFMAYMPFTHMAHFVLKYFTYHSIRWNDEPNTTGSKLEKKITEALGYKPTWSAKHVQADGKKTWVDIATDEVYKDEK
ncbi:MAG: respiratory nitrate reductase subunit gamma [Candidatus Zixiibacteriota bacterium]